MVCSHGSNIWGVVGGSRSLDVETGVQGTSWRTGTPMAQGSPVGLLCSRHWLPDPLALWWHSECGPQPCEGCSCCHCWGTHPRERPSCGPPTAVFQHQRRALSVVLGPRRCLCCPRLWAANAGAVPASTALSFPQRRAQSTFLLCPVWEQLPWGQHFLFL